MSSPREKLHLRLTAIALVGAIGLSLLLHKPVEPELPDASGLAAHCLAMVLASEDFGSRGTITIVVWQCLPMFSVDRWIDARR